MRQHTHQGLREDTARQPDLTGREDLTKSAPTEPEAFPLWGAQRRREEGKFELSHGVWARQDDGSWPGRPTELVGREGTVALGGLDVELSMAAIFRGIPDAPTVE